MPMFWARLRRLLDGGPDVSGAGEDPKVPARAPDEAAVQGFLEELSAEHAYGWAWMPDRPDERVSFDIVLEATGEVVALGVADEFKHGLSLIGIGDGTYGFWVRLARPLDACERGDAVVRVAGSRQVIPRALNLLDAYEPVQHVAMDIVDNCNLRCPFCLYDYEGVRTTHFMSDETLAAALRFLPFTRDGEFWFSCLHEPTLHPSLPGYIDGIPLDLRRKLFFTTNLAKPMDQNYFVWLAGNGMHHINVSVESRNPAIYERMRKGARWRIFSDNWDRLIAALDDAATPTPIRYIAMAYKSNLRELPGLVRYLLEERRAAQVELRYTFKVPHISPAFRDAEFLDEGDWDWLAAEISRLADPRVVLIRPPKGDLACEAVSGTTASAARGTLLPGRVMLRLSWDGTLKAIGMLATSRGEDIQEETIFDGNVRDVGEPGVFLARLDRKTAHT